MLCLQSCENCATVVLPVRAAGPWHGIFGIYSMFRNLFRHLEDISANTRQQQSTLSDSGKWSARISEQLETLNQVLLTQSQTPAAPNQDMQTLNQEFHTLNQSLILQQQRSIRFLRIISFTMAGFGVCLIALISIYSLNLSQFSRKAADETIGNNRVSAIALDRYKSLGDKQNGLEEQVTRLDSVVAQQAQMIAELKKLNTTAVRTFIHIRRDLDQRQVSDAPIVSQQPGK